jgi:hypothetical protein
MSTALERENEHVGANLAKPKKEGEIWLVIAAAWFEKWKLYVNFNESAPQSTAQVRTQNKLPYLCLNCFLGGRTFPSRTHRQFIFTRRDW